jgi:hypothetical protein
MHSFAISEGPRGDSIGVIPGVNWQFLSAARVMPSSWMDLVEIDSWIPRMNVSSAENPRHVGIDCLENNPFPYALAISPRKKA